MFGKVKNQIKAINKVIHIFLIIVFRIKL